MLTAVVNGIWSGLHGTALILQSLIVLHQVSSYHIDTLLTQVAAHAAIDRVLVTLDLNICK